MANTELFKMDRENRLDTISKMDNASLLEELDDTIQIDMMKMSTEQFVVNCRKDKQVYLEIISEIRKRLSKSSMN